MIIYTRIKELCEEKKITIAALERELGFSKGAVSKWVRNFPNAAYLVKVADYFMVTTDYLLGRSDIRIRYESIDEDCLQMFTEIYRLGIDKELLGAMLETIIEKYPKFIENDNDENVFDK